MYLIPPPQNPNLEVYPLEPTPGTDALLLNNLATSILVKLSEIPQSAKSLILEFSAPFNHVPYTTTN